jgi:hypothetical protein
MFKDKIFGVIYIIKHKTDDTKKVYVGSTNDLKRRIWQHKSSCNNEKNKDYNINLYQYIRENGGFNEYEFIILECYVCNFKYELHYKEDNYIKMYPNNLNSHRAYLTGQEIKEYTKKYRDENKEKELERKKKYREEHKEKINEKNKKYRDENKYKIKEKNKKYRDENKDKIKEKDKKYCDENKDKIKKYYDENKDKIKERIKKYYDKNKEKINEKINCECGTIVSKHHITTHRKSLKHIAFIEQKNNVIL